MANKIRSTLRQDVLDDLGESVGFFTATDINRWLADGVEDVATRVEPLVTSSTVDLVHTTGEFALPNDLIVLKKVLVKNTASSAWRELSDQWTWEDLFEVLPGWESATPSTPTHYYWRDDVVGIYPQKASPSVTDGLRVIYAYRPAPMDADSDTTGLPDWLDKCVVAYAVWRGRIKDKTAGFEAQQHYLKLVKQYGHKVNLIQRRQTPRITVDPNPYRLYYSSRGRRSELIRLAAP